MSEYTADLTEMLLTAAEPEPHIVIAADRSVLVPDDLKEIAAQFDHNIETVTFDCPRYWDGHDFSKMHVFVNYRCADGKIDSYPCDPPAVDAEDETIIHFDWTLSRNVTCAKGVISFLVCVKSSDENGVLQNQWSSRLNQEMEVLEGIECNTEEIIPDEPDVIERILNRLDALERKGGGSDVNAELPFTENEISGVASGGGFVVNPTNFADGKTYFRYHAGATYGFRWTNPNPQKGSLTITMRGYSQYSNSLGSSIFVEYTDGTNSGFQLPHGETVTYTTDPNKTVDYIRGNYDFENWVLLDMDVLAIVADYPAPAGTVKSVNGILPDENGNVEIPVSGGTLFEPAEDDIPKVFFGGALQQTKDEVVVPFRYISKTQDVSGYAEIKAQGNSSMSYPKKNQTVKLYKDEACTEKLKIDFKGWGKQSKHCYKANWIDLSHARNVVSARLWGDVVKSRAEYESLPELLRTSPNQGAVDGFPVKVYAAGVYQGRYTINIPKDAWMANMDDELDNHCILCGENYVSGCFRAAANINGSDWTDEVHDTVPASIKTRWNEVISFVMNSTDEEFKANLGSYFYVDSLIDYYLFGLVSCGLDAFGKNQLYMTYNGQKWIATMYDMDSTWGLWWNGSSFVATDYDRAEYQDFKDGAGNLLFIRLEELFCESIKVRWEDLKHGALSIENIINRFERFTDIAPAELVKEDYASTTGGGKFTGIPSKETNNIQQLRAYANARLAWTDEYIAGLTPEEAIPCTGVSFDKSTLNFTAEGTQTVTATVTPDGCTDTFVWVSSNPSVASIAVDGYVCTVTAKTNGSATITATCGEYSATCTVSVSGIEEDAEGGFELPPEDITYSLDAETTFNGSSDYIDTGVLLFDTQKDFTVLMHADFAQNNSGTVCAMHCVDEDADLWPGLSVEGSTTYALAGGVTTAGGWGSYASGLPNTMTKIAIRAKNGVVDAVRYFNDGEVVTCTLGQFKYAKATQTAVLGCRVLANGTRDRYWKGTIYSFAIANRALGDSEIEAFLYGKKHEYVACTGITLSADTLSFTSAGTQTLTATVTPNNTTDAVVWESDDASVCAVSGGVVTAKKNGSATITATCGAYSATCMVTVSGIAGKTYEASLENGSVTTASGYTITVTGENHVKIDNTNGRATAKFIPLSHISRLAGGANEQTAAKTFVEPSYVLKSGDVIHVVKKNVSLTDASTGESVTSTSGAALNLITSAGEIKTGADYVVTNGFDYTKTMPSDYEVDGFIFWCSAIPVNTILEFDVEMYVNDERYC